MSAEDLLLGKKEEPAEGAVDFAELARVFGPQQTGTEDEDEPEPPPVETPPATDSGS